MHEFIRQSVSRSSQLAFYSLEKHAVRQQGQSAKMILLREPNGGSLGMRSYRPNRNST